MKSFGKILLLSAVAVMAVAVSVAPSEAAKKKKMAKMAKPPSACTAVGTSCTMGGSNVVHYCNADHKWTPVLMPACTGPGCPPPCK